MRRPPRLDSFAAVAGDAAGGAEKWPTLANGRTTDATEQFVVGTAARRNRRVVEKGKTANDTVP